MFVNGLEEACQQDLTMLLFHQFVYDTVLYIITRINLIELN